MTLKIWPLGPAVKTTPYNRALQFCDALGRPYPITGWDFEAAWKRANNGAADFTLATVSVGEGFIIRDNGVFGVLAVSIDTTTLAGVPGTTGEILVYADLIGTPPGGAAYVCARLCLPILSGV